jgi:uncharacterized membrane protein
VIVINLLMRWLHIFSVITAVGATVLMRFVLVPSLTGLSEQARSLLQKDLRPRLQILTHSAIGGILLSGLYNTHLLWKTSLFPYGYLYVAKVTLALILFLIATSLTSSNPKRAAFQANRKKWLGINFALAVIVVFLSACLRSLHQP